MLLEKNLHLSSHQADIQLKLLTFEIVILVEYQLSWMKFVDFLLKEYFFIQSYFSLLTPYIIYSPTCIKFVGRHSD